MRFAQDFEEFYARQQAPANEVSASRDTLPVMSVDSKGVRMVHDSLRAPTRKEAEHEAMRPKGDPMAKRKERTIDAWQCSPQSGIKSPESAKPPS